MVVLLLLSVSLIIYAIFKYVTLNNDYFEKRGIPHLKPTFLYGNMGDFLMNRSTMYEFATKIYSQLPGKKIIGMFDMRKPSYVIRDPDAIKQVAVKDFDHFVDHRTMIDETVDPMIANGLFSLTGSKWRDMRATLSPAFTGSKMRQMFELVVECAAEMSETFKKQATSNNGYVDNEMKEVFRKYTNDVISTTAFGYKINSFDNPNNEFLLAGKKFMEFNTPLAAMKFMLMSTAPRIAKMFNISFTEASVRSFFRSMVLGNMESREKNGIFRPDMINILMNVKKGTMNETKSPVDQDVEGFATVEESTIGMNTVKRAWSDDELVAQCFLFFLAGFETSSTLITFLSHELMANPEIQQKLYEEVKATHESLGGKGLTYDVVQKMKYMDMVVSETLRYYPPAPIVDRICVKDYDYDDGDIKFKIEKGQYFFIPIYGFHHDEKYWTNPGVFDPERFSDENKGSIKAGAYIPFGVGPRNCIGSRFALMEAKAVIYYLLLNFTFEPNAKTTIPLKIAKSAVSVDSEKGVHVRLSKRN